MVWERDLPEFEIWLHVVLVEIFAKYFGVPLDRLLFFLVFFSLLFSRVSLEVLIVSRFATTAKALA